MAMLSYSDAGRRADDALRLSVDDRQPDVEPNLSNPLHERCSRLDEWNRTCNLRSSAYTKELDFRRARTGRSSCGDDLCDLSRREAAPSGAVSLRHPRDAASACRDA